MTRTFLHVRTVRYILHVWLLRSGKLTKLIVPLTYIYCNNLHKVTHWPKITLKLLI